MILPAPDASGGVPTELRRDSSTELRESRRESRSFIDRAERGVPTEARLTMLRRLPLTVTPEESEKLSGASGEDMTSPSGPTSPGRNSALGTWLGLGLDFAFGLGLGLGLGFG